MTLVCFAVKQEARPFVQMIEGEGRLSILVTGMGRRNTAEALRAALARGQPHLVLSCGFAGGLNPELASGTVLFEADEGTDLSSALEAAGARRGRFHCLDRVAWTAEEKRAIWKLAGADAVEMESGVARQICEERGIPSATVRVILDEAGADLPLDFNKLMTSHQSLDSFKLALALLRAPGRIPALIRLGNQTRAAARRLATVLARALMAKSECSSGRRQSG